MKKIARKKKADFDQKDHYTTILVEDLKSNFRIVAEAVEALQEGQSMLISRIDHFEEEFNLKLLDNKNSMHGHLLITKQDLHAYLVQSKQDLRTELVKTIQVEIAKNLQPVRIRLDRCEKDVLDLKKAI